ncbi:MAG: biotin--[acetyl-CoA-carboxylase] ligase [Methanosarcinales archaeon]|nr:biotin--[acetyl-CoA-carboxylase] ligase [Methanosarcinales archaeon]
MKAKSSTFMQPREKILEILKEKHDEFVSGEYLSQKLDISRTMVWKHVESMREGGYLIESVTSKGYRLREIPDLLLPAEVKQDLKTNFIGKEIHYFDEIKSTSAKAKELATDNPDGTVIIAERQIEGRGRMGKGWYSPPGGIWFSMILKPKIPPDQVHKLTLVAGVAVAEVLSELGLKAEVKWPNDILINEKKVCGILTEMEAELDVVNYVIVGIGIDANIDLDMLPPITMMQTTSLREELGGDVDRIALVRGILERFERHYTAFLEGDLHIILKRWRNYSSTIGRRVKIVAGFRTIKGEAVGIDHDGALIVELDDGTVEKEIAGTCYHI